MTDNRRVWRNTIISPLPNARVYDQSISISGRIDAFENGQPPRIAQAWIDKTCIGETQIFSRMSLGEPYVAYNILAQVPEPLIEPRAVIISITFSEDKKQDSERVGEVPVNLVPAQLDERHYGTVVPPNQTKMLGRENIYGQGPPAKQPSPEALELVLRYLPPASSIVDVGCGAGAFGPRLLKAGHQWLGLEVNDHCIELLEQRKLPHRKLEGVVSPFPCRDREFDHAICIEVLEHVEEPASFLGEIARVVRGRAIFSVPNLEVLPFLKDWEVVPWHLLEADHKNFFTRASLKRLLGQYFSRVEIFSYGEHPLRTRDDIPLHIHLLAVATF